MTSFDYETQTWLTGEACRLNELNLQQQRLAVLTGPRSDAYVRSIGSTLRAELDNCRLAISELEKAGA